MKSKRLFKCIGMIDEDIIEAAEGKRRRGRWVKWCALAACLAVIAAAGIWFFREPPVPEEDKTVIESVSPTLPDRTETSETVTETPEVTTEPSPEDTPVEIDPNLPKLEVETETGGMGFAAHMLYDISELDKASPWTEDKSLLTLPVYENLAYVNAGGDSVYLEDDEMLAIAERAAAALGTEIETVEYFHGETSGKEYPTADRLSAETALCEIRVYGGGAVIVSFDEGYALPDGYSFTRSNTSREEALETISWLYEKFSALIGEMESPKAVTWGDYNIYGEFGREYMLYDGAGSLTEQIVSYYYSAVGFVPNEEGELWIIRYGSALGSAEKLGDYPIISEAEARALILNGDYLSSVPSEYLSEGVVKEEYLSKVELVYRTGGSCKVYMPYYCYYIELTEIKGEVAAGLKHYGLFYVPALESEYLTNFASGAGNIFN